MFDAREVALDSSVDFENLARAFPSFEGEIPLGSCIAVGHSASSYLGKKDDRAQDESTVNLATNILFVIIFGTQGH